MCRALRVLLAQTALATDKRTHTLLHPILLVVSKIDPDIYVAV